MLPRSKGRRDYAQRDQRPVAMSEIELELYRFWQAFRLGPVPALPIPRKPMGNRSQLLRGKFVLRRLVMIVERRDLTRHDGR